MRACQIARGPTQGQSNQLGMQRAEFACGAVLQLWLWVGVGRTCALRSPSSAASASISSRTLRSSSVSASLTCVVLCCVVYFYSFFLRVLECV